MRRKKGELVPFEKVIMELARKNNMPFYGFDIAKILRNNKTGGKLADNGTLYRALNRLEKFGLLISHWELTKSNRPPRKYYEINSESALKEFGNKTEK
jgi:DNA-binding PadR family transcriptional regulator